MDDLELPSVFGQNVGWYFPRPVVRRFARFLDERKGGTIRKDESNSALVERITAGSRRLEDIAGFSLLLGRVWLLAFGLSFVPILSTIALTSILGFPSWCGWIIGLTGSLISAVLSFGIVFYLHGVAMAQYAEDGDAAPFIVRHFLVPNNINLMFLPAMFVVSFLWIGSETHWYSI